MPGATAGLLAGSNRPTVPSGRGISTLGDFSGKDQKMSLDSIQVLSPRLTACCVAGVGQAIGVRDFWLPLTEESVNDCENCHYFYCFPDRQLGTVPKGELVVRAGAASPWVFGPCASPGHQQVCAGAGLHPGLCRAGVRAGRGEETWARQPGVSGKCFAL